MRNQNRSRIVALVLLALLSSTALTGCGMFRNIFGGDDRERKAAIAEYVAANKLFTDDQISYTAARVAMRSARIARKVDEDKWLDYRLSQNAIIAAAPIVESDLKTWGETGKKPDLYEAHNKTLRDALADVLNIAKEFQQ